jgi:rod shape determining protein RodA
MLEGNSASIMQRAVWRHFDLPQLIVTILLIVLSGMMIYSSYEASLPQEGTTLFQNTVFRQAVFALAGLVLYLVVTAIDYHLLITLSRWIYLFILILLGVTMLLGRTIFGAQSWVQIWENQGFQPSEFAKILMIIVIAQIMEQYEGAMESSLPFFISALMVAPPVVLIYLQPDFGIAVLLFLTWVGMVFLAGVRWRHILLLVTVGIIAAPLVWFRMEDYMRDRILMLILPGYDPTGSSYNIQQALISIGSGGWWGKGWGQGTQSQLHFLRVRHTDFIFSVIAEEFGFVGSVLVLALFAFLILRLVRAAALARDTSGRMIVSGIAVMLLIQTLINVGMNANILPVTGLTLPLISYGGSSLVSTLFGLGLAQSVLVRHKDPEPDLL